MLCVSNLMFERPLLEVRRRVAHPNPTRRLRPHLDVPRRGFDRDVEQRSSEGRKRVGQVGRVESETENVRGSIPKHDNLFVRPDVLDEREHRRRCTAERRLWRVDPEKVVALRRTVCE